MKNLTSKLSRFKDEARGSVALIFALSCVVLMALTGLAIDTARYHDISTRMQQALDGASLAAAKLLSDPNLSDSDVSARALAYFNAAVPTFGVKPSAVGAPIVTIDRAASSVEVSGEVLVPAFFGGLANLPGLSIINQKSKVVYDMTRIELSMVLDITGSMGDKNKIGDLKGAAKDVIDTLFDGALNDQSVRIAIAPYSASVNAGSLASAVSAAPSTTTCTSTWYGTKCTTTAGIDADTCVIERKGANAATDAAPGGTDMLTNMDTPSWGNYFCPSANVVPLMDRTQRDNLKAMVDGFQAMGSTAGHIGTAWGWYLLSPNWGGVFPAASKPGNYGDTAIQKNMIVMTDGLFNTSYISGNAPVADGATQTTESYAQFDALCDGAKNAGITIYTVGFDLNDATALAHLESCASSASTFYDVKNGNQLKGAFKDIASKLGNLRVAG